MWQYIKAKSAPTVPQPLESVEFIPLGEFLGCSVEIFAVAIIGVLKLQNVLKINLGIVGFFDKHFVIFVATLSR